MAVHSSSLIHTQARPAIRHRSLDRAIPTPPDLKLIYSMSGNKNLNLAQSAREIEKNFELVQPRAIPVEQQTEREAARDKIKVRAAQRGEMAKQQIKAKKASAGSSGKGGGKARESRLIPAGGAGAGGQGMGMSVDQ